MKKCTILHLCFSILLIPAVLWAADLLPAGQITDFSPPLPSDVPVGPPQDWGDVIGNPGDGHGANTLSGYLKEILEHIHKEAKVYPTLADCVTVTSGAGDWALGSFVEVVPINTITEEFDIHQVIIETFNTKNKTYELVIYYGGSDTEAGRIRFQSGDNKGNVDNGAFQTPLISENSKIRAKLAIEDGGSKTACISIRYHTY